MVTSTRRRTTTTMPGTTTMTKTNPFSSWRRPRGSTTTLVSLTVVFAAVVACLGGIEAASFATSTSSSAAAAFVAVGGGPARTDRLRQLLPPPQQLQQRRGVGPLNALPRGSGIPPPPPPPPPLHSVATTTPFDVNPIEAVQRLVSDLTSSFLTAGSDIMGSERRQLQDAVANVQRQLQQLEGSSGVENDFASKLQAAAADVQASAVQQLQQLIPTTNDGGRAASIVQSLVDKVQHVVASALQLSSENYSVTLVVSAVLTFVLVKDVLLPSPDGSDGEYNSDTPYPDGKYDDGAARRYFSRRFGSTIRRSLQIALQSLQFAASLVQDKLEYVPV